MRFVALLNARSGRGGSAKAAARLEELFRGAGHEITVVLAQSGARIRSAAEAAAKSGCDALLAGGGDGTINTVADAARHAGIPLGVLPLGTRNHFARDAGIPLDLEGAVAVILAGNVSRVDLGEVNGRIFINNSSIGVYPRLVRLRERHQKSGLAKWLAALWALLAVLRRHAFIAVRLTVDGEAIVRRTPFVFVGNNAYRMAGPDAARRDSLSGGELSLYVMNASGRRNLLWLAWQVLLGRTEELKELDTFTAAEIEVETRQRWPHVALDGEIVSMAGTLRYRVLAGALQVYVPVPA